MKLEELHIGFEFTYMGMKWRITNPYDGFKATAINVIKNGRLGKYCQTIRGVKGDGIIENNVPNNKLMGRRFLWQYMEKPPKRVPFEYSTVSKYTEYPDKYITAKDIKINKAEVLDILSILCKKFNISMKKGIWKIDNRPGRGWGGYRVIKKKRVPYISLPMNNGHTNVWLLCHEFAHVVHKNRWKTIKDQQPHGKEFTKILDNIILYYFDHIHIFYKNNLERDEVELKEAV